MTKIFDCFLFFQELELAEIRMAYLYDHVDHFIILEAAQTFSGKPKPFNFEANWARFQRFTDKIIYLKVEDQHDTFGSVISHLAAKSDPTSAMIRTLMENHRHYDRSVLAWVLDTYHRENLHYGIQAYAKSGDIVILSDLDEIPTLASLRTYKDSFASELKVFEQREFRYKLNLLIEERWSGTIAGPYDAYRDLSLNSMKNDSKTGRDIVEKKAIADGGYHFTSLGDAEMIRRKIASWAHQEYNTELTMTRLEQNIKTGQDIFNRETGTLVEQIDIATSDLFDDTFRDILLKYPHLIQTTPIEHVEYTHLGDIRRRAAKTLSRIGYEIRKYVGKL